MFDETLRTSKSRSATIVMFRDLHGYRVGHAYKVDDSVEDLCITRVVHYLPARHFSLGNEESGWTSFKDMAALYASQDNIGLDVVLEPEARYVLKVLEQSFSFEEGT